MNESEIRAAALRAIEIRTSVPASDKAATDHTVLDQKLDGIFEQLGLAGHKRPDGSIATAYDTTMAYNVRTLPAAESETPAQSLEALLTARRVPDKTASTIKDLWAARYGTSSPKADHSHETPPYYRPKTPANITSG